MIPLVATLLFAAQPAECDKRVTVAFAGDVILHRSLQQQVTREGYAGLLDEVKPLLEDAELTIVNLEGPIAPGVSRDGYNSKVAGGPAGFPRFNFPASLASALKERGVDVVQTANNHVLDRGSRGVDATLKHVEEAGLVAVGSRRAGSKGNRAAILEVEGVKIGIFACTFWANGKPDPQWQVQFCHGAGRKRLFRELKAARAKTDAIFVLVHWGIEDAERPGGSQVRFAKALIDAGADAVVGTHPHVLHRVRSTRGKTRSGVVAYSLGNLVSAQLSKAHRTGAVLYLDLVRSADGVVVDGTRVVPTFIERGERVRVVPLTEASPSESREIVAKAFSDEQRAPREGGCAKAPEQAKQSQ